jgi:hypothetical protein
LPVATVSVPSVRVLPVAQAFWAAAGNTTATSAALRPKNGADRIMGFSVIIGCILRH